MSAARVRLAVLALALAVAMCCAVPPGSAQELPDEPATVVGHAPDAPTTADDGGLVDLLPDPKAWAAEVFTEVLTGMLRAVSEALRSVVGTVQGSSLNVISQTPPSVSYASPTVQTLWGVARAIANAALALAALWGGFNLVVREQIGAPYHDAMELFPRLALAALLANTSLWWAQLAIDANNALCQAVGQVGLPSWERADPGARVLVEVVAILVYLIAGLLLVLQMLMRLALLDVLLVLAPLAVLCWVLPQTQGWARLWSSLFFSATFVQFVQVVALKLGGSLLTDLSPIGVEASLVSVLLSVAVLLLTLRLPGLLRGQLGDGFGLLRYLAYRQAARALEGRGGGGAGRAAGGRGRAAGGG